MKVIVGSKNKDKVKIVENALKNLHLEIDVDSVGVDSGIADQSLDREITKKRAINRAENARKSKPEADFWIGLEGGLHKYDEGYHLITLTCLIDKEGTQYIDEGEEIHLSEEVSPRVKKREWFGEIIREYSKNNKIDENLITGLGPFTKAVQSVYVEYLKQADDMKFRQRTSAVVKDGDENFLIVQLTKYGEDDWNFPGGGIEEGEKPEEAVLRELKEELGTDKFEIIKKSEYKEVYDWPNWLIAEDISNKKQIYRGQEATFFLVKFSSKREDIKLDPNELRKAKWVKYEDIKNHFKFSRQIGLTDKLRDLVEE